MLNYTPATLKNNAIVILASIFMLFSTLTNAESSARVNQIIDKANLASYYAGEDGRAQARMIIVDENGKRQMRQFTILRKDKEDLGAQSMMVFFSKPSNVKGTVFRVEKHVDKDDNRWLFLPALDLLKRISAGDKRTSFVGSHFYYEDVSGRNPKDDTFSLVSEDAHSYTITAIPKNAASVEFASYTVKIDKKTFIPMETTYFDNNEKAIRKMSVLSIKEIDGIPTVMKSRISDLTNNGYTDMQFRKVKYNAGLPESIFSERNMRTPPKAWLK